MNPLRKQRLYALIAVLIGSLLATWLVVSALSENMNLFYSPSEILEVDIDENGLRTYTLKKRNNIVLCHVWLHVFYVTRDQRQPQTLCYKP